MKRAELDQRREVGLIITDSRIAGQIQRQFDADWESAKPKVELVPPSETAEGARASAE
jgi:phosphatidylserine/phosphatidylglycerophosphate/cardiolipin synthase-like enzyme